MKKLFALTLVLLLLLSAAALAEEPYEFSFRGITWNSTPEDVAAIEDMSTANFHSVGNVTFATGSNYEVGEYPYFLIYIFVDNKLTALELSFNWNGEDLQAVLDSTAKAFIEEYGEPNCKDYETINKIFSFFPNAAELTEEDVQNNYGWLLPDQRTVIFLANLDGGGLGIAIFDLEAVSQGTVTLDE